MEFFKLGALLNYIQITVELKSDYVLGFIICELFTEITL